MSNEYIYHSQWSVDDIIRFVDGQLTTDEMSRFEADLASDPFFKDAVDGYAGHARIHVDHHLQRLNNQFSGKSKRKLAVPMWAIGAAASLVLLVSAWFLFGPQLMENGLAVLADNRQHEKQSVQKSDRKATTFEAMENESGLVQNENIEILSADTIESRLAMNEEIEPPSMPSGVRSNRPQSTSFNPRRRAQKKKIGGIVSGAVVDQNGEPLIGANIYFPSNQAGITTDFNGKFAVELKSYDSVAIVNYTGFTSGVFSISSKQNNKFQLNADIGLAEVAVTAVPTSTLESDDVAMDAAVLDERVGRTKAFSESSNDAEIQPKSAQPEKGYKKYERYIRRNLSYPSAARAAGIEGVVKLQFKVLANGDIFDVRVVKSLGMGCDEEAVRLIKEGPSWASADQKAVRQGHYEVEFSLQ